MLKGTQNWLRLIALLALLTSSCAGHRQIESNDYQPDIICDCISPYNDPDVMKEWMKIEDKLHAHGISVRAISSIGASFYASPQQADEARAIVSAMVKAGEVNVDLLQLKIIKNQPLLHMTKE